MAAAELVVVEDDATVLTLLGRVLEAEGYRVRSFPGSEGVPSHGAVSIVPRQP